MHTCLNSTAYHRSLQERNCYVTLWKTAQQCNLKWDYLNEKERDIVRGERCLFQKIILPLCLHSCHISSISLHCHDFTSCPEHYNKSSGAGEKDVTDNFIECAAWLLMRFFFLPEANITTHFLYKNHFLKNNNMAVFVIKTYFVFLCITKWARINSPFIYSFFFTKVLWIWLCAAFRVPLWNISSNLSFYLKQFWLMGILLMVLTASSPSSMWTSPLTA